MRILIATDAWYPQPNGVVRVLGTLRDRLQRRGHTVEVVSPDLFPTIPCPTYAEIRLALLPGRKTAKVIEDFAPDAIHIATEGPIGRAARAVCLRKGWPFTTAYHTKFPQYVRARTGLPLSWLYAAVRRFHAPSAAVLVPSPTSVRELAEQSFANLVQWSHGVDTDLFQPQPKTEFAHLPRPLFLYVGRVTVEKNLTAFLDLDLPGSKVVSGSGPQKEELARRYPDATFVTAGSDAELARHFASADAFVFPSLTDTFGLVMLEALASGVPVAAFPVPGPLDVIGDSGAGVLDHDLRAAAMKALTIDAERCRTYAQTFSWERVAEEFLAHLALIDRQAPLARTA